MFRTLTILLVFFTSLAYAQQKRALIITIGDYPEVKNGWSDLHSANDAKLLQATLIASGFNPSHIALLQDKAATRKGIEKAFNDLAVSCTPGDFIIIHFSCHGQQIEDLNGDEPDGLDEALVGYNAPMHFPKDGKYKFEEHVCDDDIGVWLEKIKKEIGKNGQILVNIDACHSGSATRGDDLVRGDAPPCISPTFNKGQHFSFSTKGFEIENTPTKGEGKLVVISGSRAQESCYETTDELGTKLGTLTLAFCKSFIQIDSNTTFHSLFTRVMATMADITLKQTPTLEGDVDYKIFDGKFIQQKPYYEIVDKRDDTILVINAGSLADLHQGDKIGFYNPYSNYSLEKPEVTGTVTTISPFFAEVTLHRYLYIENIRSYWGGLIEKNVESLINSFQIQVKSKAVKDSIIKNLGGFALIRFTDQSAKATIKDGSAAGMIQIVETSSGIPITSFSEINITEPGSWNIILKELKTYAQSSFIREITMEDNQIKVEAELWPVKDVIWNDDQRSFKSFDYDSAYYYQANREYESGRQYVLKVKNTGVKNCYVSAIEIQPDNIMNVLLPYQNLDPSSYLLKPGEEKTWLHIRRFTEPFGTEVFKVFATSSVINLRSIVQNKGNGGTKGDMQPFELILNDSYMGVRGDGPGGFSANNSGTIRNIVFKVK